MPNNEDLVVIGSNRFTETNGGYLKPKCNLRDLGVAKNFSKNAHNLLVFACRSVEDLGNLFKDDEAYFIFIEEKTCEFENGHYLVIRGKDLRTVIWRATTEQSGPMTDEELAALNDLGCGKFGQPLNYND